MSELSLTELLDSVGIDRKKLAELLSVNTKTIQRMGEHVDEYVLTVIDQYKLSMTNEQSESVPLATVKPVKQSLPDTPVLPVTHRNIALSRIDYGAGIPIDTIARSLGMTVHKYKHQAVTDTVAHCKQAETSFIQLRQ